MQKAAILLVGVHHTCVGIVVAQIQKKMARCFVKAIIVPFGIAKRHSTIQVIVYNTNAMSVKNKKKMAQIIAHLITAMEVIVKQTDIRIVPIALRINAKTQTAQIQSNLFLTLI